MGCQISPHWLSVIKVSHFEQVTPTWLCVTERLFCCGLEVSADLHLAMRWIRWWEMLLHCRCKPERAVTVTSQCRLELLSTRSSSFHSSSYCQLVISVTVVLIPDIDVIYTQRNNSAELLLAIQVALMCDCEEIETKRLWKKESFKKKTICRSL